MTAFESQQRDLVIRGRTLRFVTHAGRSANHAAGRLGYPAMWYLMVEGRRCPVLPWDPVQSVLDLDAALRDWAEDNALGPVERTASPSSCPRVANG